MQSIGGTMGEEQTDRQQTLWVDEHKRAEYYQVKSRRLGQQVHELELELERVKRKSVARKRNLRSMQKALELSYLKERSLEKDIYIAHTANVNSPVVGARIPVPH
jgi:succinate dehydrogenase/fumarate reductase flavoprotein subunit